MSLITSLQAVSDHIPASPMGASVVSVLGTLGLVTQAVPLPPGLPPLAGYALTALGPVLILLVKHLLAARAARLRARASRKELKAAEEKADKDPSNDPHAAALLDEAAEERAEAEQLDLLSGKK